MWPPPRPLAVVLLSTPEPVCPYPLPASEPLTPGLGSVVLGGLSVHIQFSLTSLSSHLGRTPLSVGPALTQDTHSCLQRHGSLCQLSAQTDHLRVSGREGFHFQKHFWEDIFLNVSSFPELSDRKIPTQQNPLTAKGLCITNMDAQGQHGRQRSEAQALRHVRGTAGSQNTEQCVLFRPPLRCYQRKAEG